MDFILESTAFKNNGEIPEEYTCEGENISPPLRWSGVPTGTKSLVLIVEDPDAPDPRNPRGTWVHWVLYNIPPAESLDQGMESLPEEVGVGLNDWKHGIWEGPCPPVGRHRYFYKLYALDTKLHFAKAPAKAEVERAMKGHVLGATELVGLYEKHKH